MAKYLLDKANSLGKVKLKDSNLKHKKAARLFYFTFIHLITISFL